MCLLSVLVGAWNDSTPRIPNAPGNPPRLVAQRRPAASCLVVPLAHRGCPLGVWQTALPGRCDAASFCSARQWLCSCGFRCKCMGRLPPCCHWKPCLLVLGRHAISRARSLPLSPARSTIPSPSWRPLMASMDVISLLSRLPQSRLVADLIAVRLIAQKDVVVGHFL